VDPHQHVLPVAEVTRHQGQVLAAGDCVAVADGAKLSVLGGQPYFDGHQLDLDPLPVGNEVGDAHEGEVVVTAEHLERGSPGHRPVVVDDFADRPDRVQPGKPGQVHGGLGVPGARQHTTGTGLQRKHVSRPGEVTCGRRGVAEQPDGACPICGGDAGADSVPSVDADGVCGALGILVVLTHRGQHQPVEVGALHRDAHHTGAVPDGECQQFRGGRLGREDEVALVFPVGAVDDDNGLAGADITERTLDPLLIAGLRLRGLRLGRAP